MTRPIFHTACAALIAVPVLLASGPSPAQNRDNGGFLNNLFSRGEPSGGQQGAPQGGQGMPQEGPDASDLTGRMSRIEGALREMTGTLERLQHENQQLKMQLQRMQEDNEFRFRELGAKSPPPSAGRQTPQMAPQAAPQSAPPPSGQPGRRSDVFDPSQHPAAPGAPRTLGSMSSQSQASAAPAPIMQPETAPVGAPGGRAAGAPLDLSTLSGNAAASAPPIVGGPPPQAGQSGRTQVATLPPSASPKDEFDLAYGYVLHKDYALAEQAFQTFLKKHQANSLEPEARYWLGETYYQRQRYQDAADSFLIVVRNFEKSAKAPEALLRLGQSLAAMHQKELACASLGEVERKYPRASASVKRAVEQEQKRTKC
jgi:tol-pal system protein YbgF